MQTNKLNIIINTSNMKQSNSDLLQIPRGESPLRRTSHHTNPDQQVIPFH